MAWPGLVVVPEHVVTRQAWGFHSFNNLLGAACCSEGDVTQIYTPTLLQQGQHSPSSVQSMNSTKNTHFSNDLTGLFIYFFFLYLSLLIH